MIDFQFRKWNLIIRFASEIKVDPVFSNWAYFNKKVSFINFSSNSNSLKAIHFFLQNSKVKDSKKNIFLFSIPLRSLHFSNSQMAMFLLLS